MIYFFRLPFNESVFHEFVKNKEINGPNLNDELLEGEMNDANLNPGFDIEAFRQQQLVSSSNLPFSFTFLSSSYVYHPLKSISGQNTGSYTGTPSSNIWDNIIFTVPNGETNVVITNRDYNEVQICKLNYL